MSIDESTLLQVAAVGGIITGVRAVYDIVVWVVAHVADDVRDEMGDH